MKKYEDEYGLCKFWETKEERRMTTTELIAFLKKYEFGGATGRPREVRICADGKIYDSDIKNFSTGDGLITELYIDIGEAEEDEA